MATPRPKGNLLLCKHCGRRFLATKCTALYDTWACQRAAHRERIGREIEAHKAKKIGAASAPKAPTTPTKGKRK